MITTLNRMEKDGSTGKLPKMPRDQNLDLEKYYEKKAKKLETPAEINQYPIENFADVSSAFSREAFVLHDSTSYEDMILRILKSLMKNVRRM